MSANTDFFWVQGASTGKLLCRRSSGPVSAGYLLM
jgi:hypothetical protein